MLQHLLETGRLPHAFLLHGPDGVGKRSLAFAMAKVILSAGLPVREATLNVASNDAPMDLRLGEPLRSPDDGGDLFGDDEDMFGGMDDLFGGAAEEPEPPREPAPKDEPQAAEPEPQAEGSEDGALFAAFDDEQPPVSVIPPVRYVGVDARLDRKISAGYPINYEEFEKKEEAVGTVGVIDLNVVEPIGKSNSIVKVGQLRTLQEFAGRAPFEGHFRVVLIFSADTMSVSAANSLLKWLEEPPSYLILILVTDHYHRVLETIRSRCMGVGCFPLERLDLKAKLIDEEKVEPELAGVAASLSEGRPGRALSVLDGSMLRQRQDVFEARLAIDRVGAAALPMAVHQTLKATNRSLAQSALLLLSLARDRMVRQLVPGVDDLLVNHDLAGMMDDPAIDPAHLYEEAERLLATLRMEDHPYVPAPELPLELALWPA